MNFFRKHREKEVVAYEGNSLPPPNKNSAARRSGGASGPTLTVILNHIAHLPTILAALDTAMDGEPNVLLIMLFLVHAANTTRRRRHRYFFRNLVAFSLASHERPLRRRATPRPKKEAGASGTSHI
jgi:hypothetical protein